MVTYISEDTDEPVTIKCTYFDRPEHHCPNPGEPAVALRGQWKGGDIDQDPVWVPVCPHHDAKWATNVDTGEVMEAKYQLPRFALEEKRDLAQEMLEALRPVLMDHEDVDWSQVVMTTFLSSEWDNGYFFNETAYCFDAHATEIADVDVSGTAIEELLSEFNYQWGSIGRGYELVVNWVHGTVEINQR